MTQSPETTVESIVAEIEGMREGLLADWECPRARSVADQTFRDIIATLTSLARK